MHTMNNIDYMHLKLSKLRSPMHACIGRTDLLEVCLVVYTESFCAVNMSRSTRRPPSLTVACTCASVRAYTAK